MNKNIDSQTTYKYKTSMIIIGSFYLNINAYIDVLVDFHLNKGFEEKDTAHFLFLSTYFIQNLN